VLCERFSSCNAVKYVIVSSQLSVRRTELEAKLPCVDFLQFSRPEFVVSYKMRPSDFCSSMGIPRCHVRCRVCNICLLDHTEYEVPQTNRSLILNDLGLFEPCTSRSFTACWQEFTDNSPGILNPRCYQAGLRARGLKLIRKGVQMLDLVEPRSDQPFPSPTFQIMG
jgi:hypothetical protein